MAAGKTRLRANPEKSQRTVWVENRFANGRAKAPTRPSDEVSFKTAKPHG